MERFCWKGHVNPGKLEEYAAKHNAMCRQMEELMRAAGMRNYSIWANGEDTIGYYEYLGPERKAEVYEQHRDILDVFSSGTFATTSFIAIIALCSEFILLLIVVSATILPVSSSITAFV